MPTRNASLAPAVLERAVFATGPSRQSHTQRIERIQREISRSIDLFPQVIAYNRDRTASRIKPPDQAILRSRLLILLGKARILPWSAEHLAELRDDGCTIRFV